MNFIKTSTGAEYATDFTFFVENQVAVCESFNGTTIFSRLEQKAFYKSEYKNLSLAFIHNKLKEIHTHLLTSKN